jgi:Transmembrane amino acid transporter protein
MSRVSCCGCTSWSVTVRDEYRARDEVNVYCTFVHFSHLVLFDVAINSQAICSSMDRLLWRRLTGRIPIHTLSNYCKNAVPAVRWMVLTAVMAVTAYSVANAIPFFTDLVGLIGAVTSVPLTLLLPAIFWRKHLRVPLWVPTASSLASIALVYFSLAFMVTATIGSLYSIRQDWLEH